MAEYLTDGNTDAPVTVELKQPQDGCQNSENGNPNTHVNGSVRSVSVTAKKGGTVTIAIDASGTVTASTD